MRGAESATGRVDCPLCAKSVAVNKNGKMWNHTDPNSPRWSSSCPGAGLTVEQAKPGMTLAESETIRWGRFRSQQELTT